MADNTSSKKPVAPVMTDPADTRSKVLAAKRKVMGGNWPSDPDLPANRRMYSKAKSTTKSTYRRSTR